MAARWPPAAPNQCYHIPEGESKHLPHYSYRSLEKTVIDVVLNHMTPPKKKNHMTFLEPLTMPRGVK